jgi:hypothetical protein
MSADGNWKVTINTPMGARTMAVAITTSGDTDQDQGMRGRYPDW